MLSRIETCFFGRKFEDSRMMVRISSAERACAPDCCG